MFRKKPKDDSKRGNCPHLQWEPEKGPNGRAWYRCVNCKAIRPA